MDQRCPFFHRLQRIENGGKFFIIDFNQRQGFFRDIPVFRRHRGDFFSCEPHFLIGQKRKISDLTPDHHSGKIEAGQNGPYAG